MALLAAGAFAADVSGKWSYQEKYDTGYIATTNMEFKANGATLTGSIECPQPYGNQPIADGKIDGDTITFKFVLDRGVEDYYVGKVKGDTIAFTRTSAGPQIHGSAVHGRRTSKVTANRRQAEE